MKETKVTKKKSFLGEQSQEEFILNLRKILNNRVEAAYIFGSFLSSDFNTDSDLDLILVVDTHKPFTERHLDFPEILNFPYEVDLLIYTPEEFEKIKNEEKVGFWKSVFNDMKQII